MQRLMPNLHYLNTLGVGNLGNNNVHSLKDIADERSLDEKVYKLRVVVPKELENGKNPEEGFILQESASTNVSKCY